MLRLVMSQILTDVSEVVIMEAVSTSEMSVNEATRRKILEDSHLQMIFGSIAFNINFE